MRAMRQTLIASAALAAALAGLAATPALAAEGPFFTLANTDLVVLVAFLVFLAVLVYFRVPTMVMGMLDKRAEGIRSELDEARAIREEAQSVLASYERRQKDVQAQADRIVTQAREEARAAADQAKRDLETSIERRLAAADDQIAQARADAVRDVRNEAIRVATAAAAEVAAKALNDDEANRLIDRSIEQVGQKLH